MNCFMCSQKICTDTGAKISLTRVFKFIDMNQSDLINNGLDLSTGSTMACCQMCQKISNGLSNLLEEMEVLQMKIVYELARFENSIQISEPQNVEHGKINIPPNYVYLKEITKELCKSCF